MVYGPAPGVVTSPGISNAPVGTLGTPPDPLPSNLEPIPSATPGPAPPATDSSVKEGAKSNAGKAAYEAFRPRYDSPGRGANLARSLAPNPEPTHRSAQGRSNPAESTNPLDNLPPLDLPRDLNPRDASPTADRETRPSAATGPSPAADALAATPAETQPTAAPTPAEMSAAPGIRRFAGVESKLAGGSVPSAAGLDWLAEMGYKTLLDLRDPGEVAASFPEEVTRRGLRYHTLPITVTNLDADHVNRFQAELAAADSRPLYFCDTDGTRAGLLWYVRRVTVDKVDPQVARRAAEELGLSDARWWQAAQDYLSRTPAPPSASKPADEPKKPAPPQTGTDILPLREPVAFRPL